MTPEKRALTKEERAICERAMDRLNNEKEYQEYLLKYYELMLEGGGLKQQLLRQQREMEQKRKDAKEALADLTKNSDILYDQYQNGVAVKDGGEDESEAADL